MPKNHHSPETICETLRRLAETLGPDLTLARFTRETSISSHTVYRHFESWPALRQAAGLPPHAARSKVRYTDEELMAAFDRVYRFLGRTPSIRQFTQLTRINTGTLALRFGRRRRMLTAYTKYRILQELKRRFGDQYHEKLAAAEVRRRQ